MGKLVFLRFIVFAMLVSFPIFYHIDFYPIRQWDESRLAVSAQEMFINHRFLVPEIEGKPDEWNLKPPLMIWLQVLSMKIFGWNEWALRFPAAMATFSLCLFIFFFAKNILKQPMIGFFAGLVLVTSNGFIDFHESRTGDYDALLTFFSVSAIFFYFSFIEVGENAKRKKHLMLFFICITLGVYTKSISILMFVPALVIYSSYRKKLFDLLRYKAFFSSMLLSLGLILTYYFMREKLTPGYLLGVWQNEIGGRYLNTLENHIHPFSFYYDSLRSFQFKKWFWTLPFCFLLGICSNDNLIRKFSQYIGLCVLSYFIIISTAQTKLQWYDMPLYPLMAIIIGLGFNQILNWMLLYISRWNYRWLMAIPLGIVIAAFVDPYKNISQKVMRDAEPPWSDKLYQISYYLKNQIDSSKNISGYKLYYEEYNLQLVFYQNVLARKQQSLELINDFNDVKEGMKIVVDKELIQARIREKFNVLTINRFKEVAVFEIISAKQSIPQNTP